MYICTPDSIDLCILYFTVGLWIRTRSDLIYSILPDPDVFRSYPSKMFINQLLDVPNNCFLVFLSELCEPLLSGEAKGF